VKDDGCHKRMARHWRLMRYTVDYYAEACKTSEWKEYEKEYAFECIENSNLFCQNMV
jgi:hypothetical protein